MFRKSMDIKVKYGKKWPILALIAAILIAVPFLASSSHTTKLYVDDSASGTQNGSASHPYKTISKALKKADGKTEIHVANGTYEENITLGEDVRLFGESQSGVVIKAENKNDSVVVMKDDSRINKVTIKGGARGIKVRENAKVSIIKVTIKDNKNDGIYVQEGDVKDKKMVSISDCTIKYNGWSGIYSQKRRVSIMDTEIRNNGNDGIDLEAGTSAWIEDNAIKENSGSGIKLSIDGSNVWTRGNDIRRNTREGMEISFFGGAGRVNIEKVKLADNHRYGIARIQRASWVSGNAGLWDKYLTFGEKNYFFENRQGEKSPIIFVR